MQYHDCCHATGAARAAPGPRRIIAAIAGAPAAAFGHAMAVLRTWDQRARTRRRLADMDERLLRDMGIARTDARREAAKPFWRA